MKKRTKRTLWGGTIGWVFGAPIVGAAVGFFTSGKEPEECEDEAHDEEESDNDE